MKRAGIVGAAVLALACAEERPVVLGVVMGGGEIDAARLAIAEAMEAGLDFPLDTVLIHTANNRADPALRTAQRLVSTPGLVAVVGHSNSAASITASQVYAGHDIVQVAPHSTAPLFTQAGPHAYRLVPGDDQQGAFLADRLARAHPAARLAIVYVNDDYGRGLRQALRGALGSDARVVLDLPHVEQPDSASFSRMAAAIIGARPEVVVWLGRSNVLMRVLPAVRADLGAIPVLGGDAIEAARLLPPDDMWQEVHYVSLITLDPDGPMGPFLARFEAAFGRPPTGPEVLTYDAVCLILEAFHDGARTGASLRAWLDSLGRGRPPYQGVAGPVQFDANGDMRRSYALTPVLREPA